MGREMRGWKGGGKEGGGLRRGGGDTKKGE